MFNFKLSDEGSTVLAGTTLGRRVLSQWVAQLEKRAATQNVYLDFEGIEVATASFLRETVFALRDYCRRVVPSLYPVLANLTEEVEDEVEFLASEMGEAIWRCDFCNGFHSNPRLIGRELLDVGLQRALAFVEQNGDSSAPDLAKGIADTVGPTAWNNRLASLSQKGLIVESKIGKAKVFRSVWRAS